MSDAGDDVWTIQRILTWTQEYFAGKGFDSPRLDAELLLAEVLGCDRVRLYTHFDQPLTREERATFRSAVRRRGACEPVAYILGYREFFSRRFAVSPAVLIPRPETEHLVEAILGWVRDNPPAEGVGLHVLDVGTGSGNLAVTIAAELPGARVVATDVSAAALAIARSNAEAHEVADRVELREGDLFAALARGEVFDVVVSNPPYIADGERAEIMPDVRDYEPAAALFSGPSGTEVLDRLCDGVAAYLRQPGAFACELGCEQLDHVVARLEAAATWRSMTRIRDLQSLDRAVLAER